MCSWQVVHHCQPITYLKLQEGDVLVKDSEDHFFFDQEDKQLLIEEDQ
jgi:hypothetical protein